MSARQWWWKLRKEKADQLNMQNVAIKRPWTFLDSARELLSNRVKEQYARIHLAGCAKSICLNSKKVLRQKCFAYWGTFLKLISRLVAFRKIFLNRYTKNKHRYCPIFNEIFPITNFIESSYLIKKIKTSCMLFRKLTFSSLNIVTKKKLIKLPHFSLEAK